MRRYFQPAAAAENSNIPQINPIGELDTTGMPPDGYVRYSTNIPPDNGFNKDVAIDSNGKLVIAGDFVFGGSSCMALWRYNEDGSPDSTFGGGDGLVLTNGTAGGAEDYGNGVVIDGSGRIVVVGYGSNAAGNDDMVVWRFDANGDPDTSFNGVGRVLFDRGLGGDDVANAVKIDANDRILVTGSSQNGTDDDMAVWVLLPDGNWDTSGFGVNGTFFHHNASGGNSDDAGKGIGIDAEGGVFVTGYSSSAVAPWDLVVWKLTPAGVLDTSFNGDGIVVYNLGDGDSGENVVVDPDGRIVVVGSGSAAISGDLLVARYSAAGELDTTFNDDGVFVYSTGEGDIGYGITIDLRGRILASGSSGRPGHSSDMILLRLTDLGALDTTFDSDGFVLFEYQPVSQVRGSAVATDATGRIVIAGGMELPPVPPDYYYYPAIWRYR